MPIDKEAFERGIEADSIKKKIREFLYEHDQQAFTVNEIAAEITDPDVSKRQASDRAEELSEYQLDSVAVKAVLINLYDRGAIEARLVEENNGVRKYYRGLG